MSRAPFHQPRVLPALSNLALSTAREGAATAPLGSPGQGLTTLRVKSYLLISNLNVSKSFSLKPLPLVLSLQALVQSPPPGTIPSLACCPRCWGCSPGDAWFSGCENTPPGHVELLTNQQPQVLLLRAALNPFSAQPGLGLALPRPMGTWPC